MPMCNMRENTMQCVCDVELRVIGRCFSTRA